MAMSAPRILVCPLNWGLGHAARCVPIIQALRAAGAVPVPAADGGPLELLRNEFPDLECLHFPGVTVKYPASGAGMFPSMLRQSPALLAGIRKERQWVAEAVAEYAIQGVISDNRFGAYSRRVPSAYITHQVHIQTGNGFTDTLARMQHARYMKNYARVWIPDLPGEPNLSGKLSHGKHIPQHARYIGPLSRFTTLPAAEKRYDVALLLSGPEPQRTLLEEKFLRQLGDFPHLKFALVRGKNEPLPVPYPHLTVLPLANRFEVQTLYAQATHVVCRSGYSSVMELAATGRPAWLVPTPGQTEQEYLARYLDGKHGFRQVRQERFSLEEVLREPLPLGEPFLGNVDGLTGAVDEFLGLM